MKRDLHLISEDLAWWVERAHREIVTSFEWLLSNEAEFQRLYPEPDPED